MKAQIRIKTGWQFMTMMLCTLLFSCSSDNLFENGGQGETCDNICFGIAPAKISGTRGLDGSDSPEHTTGCFVLRSDNSADTLCVRAIVSDGIDSPRDDGLASTRGMAIDKDSFYDKFHVLAYWQKDGTLVSDKFYMNENASKSGSNLWKTSQTYYWPGANHSFRFYAWAPADVTALTAPSTPQSKVLAYTVPAAVTNQKDILVATPSAPDSWTSGANNAPVPLTFKHICTAVRFAAGNQMQPGTIRSIALKGVRNAGTYDMDGATWTPGGTTADFTQILSRTTTGAESNGELITPSEGTFMMLPQTLPAGATLEVVFANTAGIERTMSASIGNSVWTMGKTVTYKLSITPEYEIDIDVPTQAQDAHYISFPITVNVTGLDGAWTLTSNHTNDIFFTKTKTDLQNQGYWIDEDKGSSTVTGNGSGSFTYYVYATENTGDAPRDLELRVTPQIAGAKTSTATVSQLCPSWNAQGVGYERIEENNGGNYPFGFKWDRKVVYSYRGFWAALFKWSADSYVNDNTRSYLTTTGGAFQWTATATIDYSKVTGNDLNVGMSTEDGLTNTKGLYFYKDIGTVSEIETTFDNMTILGDKWGSKTVTGGDYQSVQNFAVKMAVMKNKFSKEERTETNNGQTITYYVPVITEQDIKWYLPASTEQLSLSDTEYPLNGIYWSSTAMNDNVNAYTYNASTSATSTDRLTNCKIRAVRKKP